MNIAFRVDASVGIGYGHLMRCLALAEALSACGAVIHFICQDLPGFSSSLLKKYTIHLLPKSELTFVAEEQNSQEKQVKFSLLDSAATSKVFEVLPVMDLVVIDHYGIDLSWHQAIRQFTKKILVIDDLANRKYDADFLLDQTYGRCKEDYKNLVPSNARLFIGSEYALLRPEFAKHRKTSLKRRRSVDKAKRICISMGGGDSSNLTSKVIHCLEKIALFDIHLDVVVTSANPYLVQIKKITEKSNLNISVYIDSEEIGLLYSQADLAIGCGGASSWERCCLGVPTLLQVEAQNQALIARNLEKAGAVKLVNFYSEFIIEELKQIFKKISEDRLFLADMSKYAEELCDGAGATRIRDMLFLELN